jgi:hypothetical protein
MIDTVDQQLREWVATIVGDVNVSLAIPSVSGTDHTVSLYLTDILAKAPIRAAAATTHQLSLRYLVTVWAERPEDAHRLLGELLFAAMSAADFEVERAGPTAELWQAFGVAPRPSFWLLIPLTKSRAIDPPPLVREPVVVDAAPIESFHGVVLGPGEVPVANARVRLDGSGLEARTDLQGRFLFRAIPGGSRPKRLVARARGTQTIVTTTEPHPSGERPFVVRFQSMED